MSLNSLRKLHRQRVEALMMELAQIAQALVLYEARQRGIETDMHTEAEQYRAHTKRGLSIEELVEWQTRMDSQEAALRRVRFDIEQATLAWTNTNRLLVEANQERKVLDRVLERREAMKRAGVTRQEQQATDEAASRRMWSR